MLEWRKQIEVYNCVVSTVLGSSVGVLFGGSLGGGTGWGDRITVDMAPVLVPVASMGNYNDTRGRV